MQLQFSVDLSNTLVQEGSLVRITLQATGVYTFSIVVVAEDGTTSQTYTVVVTRMDASKDVELLSLFVLGGTDAQYPTSGVLKPEFNESVHTYDMEVEWDTQYVQLNATVADAYATIKARSRTLSAPCSVSAPGGRTPTKLAKRV